MHNYIMQTQQTKNSYFIFTTKAGHAAVAWKNNALTHVLLPEKSRKSLEQKLPQHLFCLCENPKPPIVKAITQIQNYFAGEAFNFSRIKLDFSSCPPFHQMVYAELLKVPPGSTTTYKELAIRCQNPKGSRAVGQAVGKNPLVLLIPCHRVIKSDATLGGFSAAGGIEQKIAMLELEDVQVIRTPKTIVAPPLLLEDVNIDEALEFLGNTDANMKRLIAKVPRFSITPDSMSSTFQALLESIVYQQLTGKAAATIFSRLLGLFGCQGSITPLDIVRAKDSELRSAGLSGSKTAAIRDLAEFALAGKLPEVTEMKKMSNNRIVNCLTAIKGIGRWTVEMMLIFKLGRADIMAPGDYGLQKGLGIIRNQKTLPSPAQLGEAAKIWKPYRSIASWYLWRASELFAG